MLSPYSEAVLEIVGGVLDTELILATRREHTRCNLLGFNFFHKGAVQMNSMRLQILELKFFSRLGLPETHPIACSQCSHIRVFVGPTALKSKVWVYCSSLRRL